MYKLLRFVFLLLFSVLTVSGSHVASAQEEDDLETFSLEEVTVTATKRVENLQQVPLSASSLVGEAMQKTGRSVLSEILRDTAGVEIRGTAQDSGIFIRGIGENTAGMGVETNVAINVNGVYSTAAQINRMSHYDVARIEVTRGPDSTLNGRTAMGGAISIITNEPTHSYEGSGSIQVGNYDLFSTQGVVNVPVSTQVALRGAYSSVKRDGYLSNGASDLDNFSGRLRALYEPGDNLKIVLTGEHNTTGGKGRGGLSYTTPIDLSGPFKTPKGAYYNPTEAPLIDDLSAYNYYADITYDFGWASLLFQPSYQTTDYYSALYTRGYDAGTTDDEPDTWNAEFTARDQNQTTFELRLTSPDDRSRVTWLAGLYYVDFEEIQEFIMPAPNATEMPEIQYPNLTDESNARWTEDTAAYAQATFELTDTFSITLGGRYTEDEKRRPALSSQTSYYYYLDDGIDNSTTGERVYFGVTAETAVTKRWDYKMALQKQLTPDAMVYFLLSTGFKGGAFNIIPADSSIWNEGYSQYYDPEYLTSFEIGSKNQLFSNTLRLNASLFYYNYEDIQLSFRGTPVSASTGVDPDWTRSVKQNAGRAVSIGGEIEVDYLLTPQNRLGLNIAYLDTEIKETDYGPLEYLEGMELPQSPNWRITPSYRHTFNLADSGEIITEISGTYVSDAIYQIPNSVDDPYNIREAYFKSNGSVTYYPPGGSWSLSGYVRNIFDKETYDRVSLPRVYSGYGNVTFIASEPRTFGVTLSAYF